MFISKYELEAIDADLSTIAWFEQRFGWDACEEYDKVWLQAEEEERKDLLDLFTANFGEPYI